MSDLHVVHRVEREGTPDESWTTYSFPEGIYTFLAWVPLVREGAAGERRATDAAALESLADAGPDVDSTVGELLASNLSRGARPSPVLVAASAA